MATNLDAANASVGKPLVTGGVWFAFSDEVQAADIPNDASTALAAVFKNGGYISDDGVTNATDLSSDGINAWGGTQVIQTDGTRSETFQQKFIETKLETLQAIYGKNNVSKDATSGEITVRHNNTTQPNLVLVFEIALTGNRVKRIVAPNAKLSGLGDVQYTDSDAIAYDGTYTALAATVFDGDTSREFITGVAAG